MSHTTLSIHIPTDLHAALFAVAETKDLSVSQLVRPLLRKLVEQEQKRQAQKERRTS